MDVNIFTDESQLDPLEEIKEGARLCYLKILANYSFSQGPDSRKYVALMSLVAEIGIKTSSRVDLRAYIFNMERAREDTGLLLDRLRRELDPDLFDSLLRSLLKDLLKIYKLDSPLDQWPEDDLIRGLVENYRIKDAEVSLIIDSIELDDRIIGERLEDQEIKEGIEVISSKYEGTDLKDFLKILIFPILGINILSIPLYLFPVGIPALLGLGIANLVNINFKSREKYRQRELILQEIIRNRQKTLNLIVEDIHELSKALMRALEEGKESQLEIIKLSQTLDYISSSAQALGGILDFYSLEEIMIKLPRELDQAKLEALTNNDRLLPLRNLVLEAYNEDMTLREDLTIDKAREVYKLLDELDYLSKNSELIEYEEDESPDHKKSNPFMSGAQNLFDYIFSGGKDEEEN